MQVRTHPWPPLAVGVLWKFAQKGPECVKVYSRFIAPQDLRCGSMSQRPITLRTLFGHPAPPYFYSQPQPTSVLPLFVPFNQPSRKCWPFFLFPISLSYLDFFSQIRFFSPSWGKYKIFKLDFLNCQYKVNIITSMFSNKLNYIFSKGL